jgi:hypothetical protein
LTTAPPRSSAPAPCCRRCGTRCCPPRGRHPLAFRHGEKVRRPCVECGAFLLRPIVPLINPDYASSASAQMVQHRVGDFEAHAEALQSRRYCPSQIMQPPTGNTGCCVER